jgi:uncharacterized membrane protein YdjX (TVP38/TMEM64 family)
MIPDAERRPKDRRRETCCPTGGSAAGRARASAPRSVRRWLPLAVILAVAGLVVATGWYKHVSLETIGLNYEALRAYIVSNWIGALAIYMLIYVAVVALSLPGALVLTIAGGLLFGWQIALPATVVAATAGATVLFMVARSSLGETLAEHAGPALARLQTGFQECALSYLLFLRLVPVFPFVFVNLAAALLDVPLRTFVLGTFLGIIPGTAAYAVAGAGLASVIAAQNASHRACLERAGANAATCPYTLDTSALMTKELVLALVLLGIVALIPVALKKWKARNAAV